ncbi:nitroreductase family deazaflavin-dependent oxidoreductase [Amycolatopsis antarctica]|uniref:Nitroreductase family deazaflavin-dependent oxidoreductase n=1 Tax=Amycolatopsis antarctica TaxID=1854586 RepID=A0A263D6A3_9PSEU|nr:nitroreductase family deazaflavin-dependent oxidoreductase [Amycolatopsis antarctica]OZM73943.1 nitroreductase family deazaflavin-dependent oxidoreductase [Amycolatopsis antarctica]
MTPAPDDFNARIIDEFRANDGKVGGPFAGAPLLLLHNTGARSGKEHVSPVMYLADGDRYVVFASKAGADTNPAWYHNLRANPEVSVEVGTETVRVRAVEVEGGERDTLYARQAALYPGFAEYEARTTRVIPVIALVPETS